MYVCIYTYISGYNLSSYNSKFSEESKNKHNSVGWVLLSLKNVTFKAWKIVLVMRTIFCQSMHSCSIYYNVCVCHNVYLFYYRKLDHRQTQAFQYILKANEIK